MQLSLNSDAQRIIESCLRSGKYGSPEEVVTAALHSLENHGSAGEFAQDEWDALIEEGEASGAALDGETVLAELRQLRESRKSN